MKTKDSEIPSINSMPSLEAFFEFIYGENQGYVYSPTKEPVTGEWYEHYFKWPEESQKLTNHVTIKSKTHEVYYAPALFKDRSGKKEDFKCTQVVWAEFDFDEDEPMSMLQDGIPSPTLRIQSSVTGHEHWYWKLNFTIPSENVLENITKKIAYAMGADKGWACNKVLRPPNTIHHVSQLTVTVLENTYIEYGPERFLNLPSISNDILNFKLGKIPDVLNVVMKYPWTNEDTKFFRREKQPEGSRSSALTRLAHIGIEMGMSNEEVYSVIASADSRWGKFKDRADRQQRLTEIVKHCRIKYKTKKLIKGDSENETPKLKIYSYREFSSTRKNIDWIVPGYFWQKCLAIISGPPGVGKTQFTVRTAMHMSIGKKFIEWNIKKPLKCMFFSLEMPYESLQYLTDTMEKSLSVAEKEALNDMFYIWPGGYGLRLDDPEDQRLILDAVKEIKPDAIFIDSFGQSIGDDMKSPQVINKVFGFVKKQLVQPSNSFVWFVHHNRKAQIGNKKPKNLDDLFGSQYISANVDTGIVLWPSGDDIEILSLKTRLAAKTRDTVFIRRTKHIDFNIGRIRNKPVVSNNSNEEVEDENFLGF